MYKKKQSPRVKPPSNLSLFFFQKRKIANMQNIQWIYSHIIKKMVGIVKDKEELPLIPRAPGFSTLILHPRLLCV